MKQLHRKCETALELDKIRERLARCAALSATQETARQLLPCESLADAQKELAKTDAAFVLSARYGAPSFLRCYDPQVDLKVAADGGVLHHKELRNIAVVIRQSRTLICWHSRCESEKTALSTYFSHLQPADALERKISSSILSDDQMADEASPALAQIRKNLRKQSARVQESLGKTLHGKMRKYLQEEIVTIRDGRYVVPVKAEHRAEIPGLVHDSSKSGSTLFIEPMSAVEANNQIQSLLGQEQEEILRILTALTGECALVEESINNDFRLICLLDLYFAKACLGHQMKGITPLLKEDGKVTLKKGRHPLIDPEVVVPIDVQLGQTFHSLIVTGPNTGGKTVVLKTVGLLSLMAKCGLMIPAEEGSKLCFFKHILVDIGDEQSIEQSLSTFSSHLTNQVAILKQAGPGTLILLDELGSGTDPVEGAALAVAIIEALGKTGARLIATTHYAELKMYALQTNGVENASCEFDVDTMRPTYRLMIGQPGRSNAFAISQRLGLDEGTLHRAQSLVSQQDRQFEQVVKKLEQTRRNHEMQIEQMQSEREEIHTLRQKLREQNEDVNRKMEQELCRAKEEAQRMVAQVKEKSNLLLNQLDTYHKEKARTKDISGKIQKQIARMAEQADPVATRLEEAYTLPRELVVGDEVMLADVQKKGVVLKKADKEGNVLVQLGMLKTRAPLENLRLMGKKTPKKSSVRTPIGGATRQGISELDLRGQSAQEALIALDYFLDHCVMAHLKQCTVIHGKGSGVLRTAVQRRLKGHSAVKSYRLGNFGEGDSGVTVVEIK